MIYNCKKRIIYPHKNFIAYNYDSKKYKTNILVDECLADEIESLWNKGIRTTGCCCGHGKYLGFINVYQDDIEKMEHLGYLKMILVEKKEKIHLFQKVMGIYMTDILIVSKDNE